MFIVFSSVFQVFVLQSFQYCAGVVVVQLINGVSVVELIVFFVVRGEGNEMVVWGVFCAWLQSPPDRQPARVVV